MLAGPIVDCEYGVADSRSLFLLCSKGDVPARGKGGQGQGDAAIAHNQRDNSAGQEYEKMLQNTHADLIVSFGFTRTQTEVVRLVRLAASQPLTRSELGAEPFSAKL